MRLAIQQTVALHIRHRLGSSSGHVLRPARCDSCVFRCISSGASPGSSRRRKVWTLAAFATGLLLPTVWRAIKKAEDRGGDGHGKLNPVTFTPYVLVSKEPVSSTNAIFTLRHERGSTSAQQLQETQTPWPQRAIWSVQIKQPQLQIARSYTPLPPLQAPTLSESADPTSTVAPYNPIAGTGLDEIRLLIRREKEGEVSGYLHSLPVGSTVELRGPHIEYEIAKDVGDIVFLAGGTGIAPALQAAHWILGNPGDTAHESAMEKARIHVLWANRRREDCLGGDNATSILDKDDLSAHRSESFIETLASYFWRSDRPSPPSSATSTTKDLSAHHHSPFAAAASRSSPPSDPSSSSEKPAPPNPIVQSLRSLRSRFPAQVATTYFVDEEGSYITRHFLERCIGRRPSSPPPLDDETKQMDDTEQRQMMRKDLEDPTIRRNPEKRGSSLGEQEVNKSTMPGAGEEGGEEEQNDEATKNKEKRGRRPKGLVLLSGPAGFVGLYAGPKGIDQQHQQHQQHQRHEDQQSPPAQKVSSSVGGGGGGGAEKREGRDGVGDGAGDGGGGGSIAAAATCGGILGEMDTPPLTRERRGKSRTRREKGEEQEEEEEGEGEGWIVHRL